MVYAARTQDKILLKFTNFRPKITNFQSNVNVFFISKMSEHFSQALQCTSFCNDWNSILVDTHAHAHAHAYTHVHTHT